MAGQCVYHPGRDAVVAIAGNNYCEPCRDGQDAARLRVDRHVVPAECFLTYLGHDDWSPMHGTGCAHWVAHQLAIQTGAPHNRCLRGFTTRVRDLFGGLTRVSQLERVRAGDIYVTPNADHCGMVSRVLVEQRTGERRIWIQHDSVRQRGLAEDEFAPQFGGKGAFYRP